MSVKKVHFLLFLFMLLGTGSMDAITVMDMFLEDHIITGKSIQGSQVINFNSHEVRFELLSDNDDYRIAYRHKSGVPITNLQLFYRSPSSSQFRLLPNHLNDPEINDMSYEIELRNGTKLQFQGSTNRSYIDPTWCGESTIEVIFYKVGGLFHGTLFEAGSATITIIWEDHCGWSDEETFGGMTYHEHPLTSTSGGNATYGILASQANSWQVFYAANDGGTGARRMYNVYGPMVNEYAYCRYSPSPGTEKPVSNHGTNFVEADGGVYFVNNDQKITKATWNVTNGWTYSDVNVNAYPVMHNTHIAVDDNGKVFYIGSDGMVRNIFGPTWEHGPLNIQAPTARANSDLVMGENGWIYYIGNDDKVHYFQWNGQWDSYVANNYAELVKDNSEMAQGDGHLFYVDTDNKVRSIDGPLLAQQYVVHPGAPNAYGSHRMGLEYTFGKVLYFDTYRNLHNLYFDGGAWQSAPITGCGVKGKVGSPIEINGNGEIWYINEFTNQPHKQVYTHCEEGGKVGLSNPTTSAINHLDGSEDVQHVHSADPASMTNMGQSGDNREFSIYPNPSSGRFTLSNLQKGEINYEILNSTGIVVREGKVLSGSEVNIELDAALAKGMYLIRWQSSYSLDIQTERIILQ